MMFCDDDDVLWWHLGGDDHVDSCGVVDDDSQLNEHNHHHQDVDDDSQLPKNMIMEKEDPSRFAFVDAAASWKRNKLVINIVIINIKTKITIISAHIGTHHNNNVHHLSTIRKLLTFEMLA